MSDLITGGLGDGSLITQGLGGDGTTATTVPAATVFTGLVLADSGTLIGNTLVLRRSEVGDQPYDVPEVSLSVAGPDGVSVSPAVTVVPSSGPTLTYILEAFVTEAVAGPYEAIWTFVASGQTLLRREFHYAYWTDVRDQVRRLLRGDAKIISDRDIDIAARHVVSVLLDPDIFGAYLPSYSSVPSTDRTSFDQALAMCVASWMRPFTPKQAALGELIGLTIGPDEYRWQPTAKLPDSADIEEMWLDEAYAILRTLGCMSGAFSWQTNNVGFVAAGRRRNTQSPLITGINGTYANPLFTQWGEWLGSGRSVGWSWGWNGGPR